MGKPKRRNTSAAEQTDVRIIGGRLRGRQIAYHGDAGTRPMKHRTREAIFNLISTAAKGRLAIDLFAGTGALGLEALSRGAVAATFIEKHVPTARVVQQNIDSLGVADQSTLLSTSAFLWGQRDLPLLSSTLGPHGETATALDPTMADIATPAAGPTTLSHPWLVFCSPPYAFYVDREADMLRLIGSIMEHAPGDSVLVVEADDRFDFDKLPEGVAEDRRTAGWQVRNYAPAVVGVWSKEATDSRTAKE